MFGVADSSLRKQMEMWLISLNRRDRSIHSILTRIAGEMDRFISSTAKLVTINEASHIFFTFNW